MDSHVKGLLTKATWLLTAIGGINWGLVPLGLDLFSLDFVRNNLGALAAPLYYLIGAAGLYSLVMFFLGCGKSCD
ncbi:MAG: DUF378 domain-containing protein [Candidatus Dependentiae bacterium]